MLSLHQRHPGQHHDAIRFRQLLCPDPFCEVCNRTTAEVNRLLFGEALEDATPSASPLASTVPVTESLLTLSPAFSAVPPGDLIPVSLPEPSLPPVSILLRNPMISSDDCVSSSTLGYSLSPNHPPHLDSKCPVNNESPPSNAFFIPQDTESVETVLQPEAPLCLNTNFSADSTLSQDISALPDLPQVINPTDSYACHQALPNLSVAPPPPDCTVNVTQSKLTSILLKSVPERSSPGNTGGLSTSLPAIEDTDHSSLSHSEFSWHQTHGENLLLHPLSDSDFQEEHVPLNSAPKHVEAGSLSFLDFNVLDLLERQIKKRVTLQILEKKAKEEGLLLKQTWPEDSQTSLGNSLQSPAIQEATMPSTGWSIEGNPELLHICQQLLYVKTLGENLLQKYSQLFWGLPSLHSESLVAALLVSSNGSSLDTHSVLFNEMGKTSGVQRQYKESPLPHSRTFALSNVHCNPMPQIKSHFHPIICTQVQPRAHVQSGLPILSPSSLSQVRDCKVSFHRPQNESNSHMSTTSQHPEWHVSQKQQEHLWGLATKLQKSQGTTCPQIPNISSVGHTSQAYIPISFLSDHFHKTSESQENLEIPVPQRLPSHQCCHSCKNTESLAHWEPQRNLREKFRQNGRQVCSQLPELWVQNNKDLRKTEWNHAGSFQGRAPTKFHLNNEKEQNLGHILGRSTQRISNFYQMKGSGTCAEKKSNYMFHSRDVPGNVLLNVSMKDFDLNQVKIILRLHLSRKFWQITVGRIPVCVCRSWLASGSASLLSGVSQTNIKNTNLINTMVSKDNCRITTIEPYFLDSNTRRVLESHIIRFQVNQMWGLPLKVREYIKFYTPREAKTWSLPQADYLSPAAKAEISKSVEGSSKAFQGNNMRITNTFPTLGQPCLAISLPGNEGQEALKLSLSDVKDELRDFERIKDGRECLPAVTLSIVDKASQTEIVLDDKCSPDINTGARYEPMEKNVNSSMKVEIIPNEMIVEKNLEHFSMLNVPREIFKAEELCSLQSEHSDSMTTTSTESSQKININMIKVETTLTTDYPSTKIADFKDDKPEDFNKQLTDELNFKLDSRAQNQAQGQPNATLVSSDVLDLKFSEIHVHSISSGDMGDSEEVPSYSEDSGMSTEQLQKTRVSEQVLRKCQYKNFSPAAKRMCFDEGDYESEDSIAGPSKARKKRHSVEDGKLENTCPSPSQNQQFSTESYLRKKMRQLFKWLDSKRRNTGQECSPQEVKFMSTFAQYQDPLESAAIFMSCDSPEAIELMSNIGKILQEKVGYLFESDMLSHPEELQVQVEPNKGYPLTKGSLFDLPQKEWVSMNSCSKEAVSADQSCLTNVRQDRGRITCPQSVMAFENQSLCQSLPHSLSSRKSMPHPRPICLHHAHQVSSAKHPPSKGTVIRDLSLLFKQKKLLQHFQEEKNSP